MKDKEFDTFTKKAEELKALFVLGQRVIPFLEEIFDFVNETKPLLEDINKSIEENLKKMPNASKQLSKVTEATELATTEIMDIVDGIVEKADSLESNINNLEKTPKGSSGNPLKIIELMKKAVSEDVDAKDLTPQIAETLSELKSEKSGGNEEICKKSKELISGIKEDSNSIMMSLQVQDITSQQIAAVNHLLETAQDKLGKIIQKFQSDEISDIVNEAEEAQSKTEATSLHKKVAFDPDAIDSIAQQETRQNDIDEMIKRAETENLDDSEEKQETNSDDIDKTFSASEENDKKTEESEKKDEKNNNENEGAFSQDDIDALFNSKDS